MWGFGVGWGFLCFRSFLVLFYLFLGFISCFWFTRCVLYGHKFLSTTTTTSIRGEAKMARRRKRIARGLDIGRVAGKMRARAELAETGGKVWEREFAIGTTNWQYWMRIIMPFIQAVGVDPDLTPEQRQVAVKETFKRVREGLPLFLARCAQAGREFAKRVIPVTVASPYEVRSPELIV